MANPNDVAVEAAIADAGDAVLENYGHQFRPYGVARCAINAFLSALPPDTLIRQDGTLVKAERLDGTLNVWRLIHLDLEEGNPS